jgi:hypothetical protein
MQLNSDYMHRSKDDEGRKKYIPSLTMIGAESIHK